MRIKSSIVKWNFDVDFRNLDENIADEIEEQLIDAIFENFDVILNVAIERCEYFDDFDSNIDVEQNIDFDDAEIDEVDEQSTADFFLILYVILSVESWKLELLMFRDWILEQFIFRLVSISFRNDKFINFIEWHDQWSKWLVCRR